MIIGLAGRKGCGKDAAADYLVKRYDFHKLSFADPLKRGLKEIFDYSDDQIFGNKKEIIDPRWNSTPRQMMQYFGTDVIRTLDEDFWIKRINLKYDKIVISDVRFTNEANFIRTNGGYTFNILRDTHTIDHHSSENVEIKADEIINNNGSLEDLYRFLDLYIYNK